MKSKQSFYEKHRTAISIAIIVLGLGVIWIVDIRLYNKVLPLALGFLSAYIITKLVCLNTLKLLKSKKDYFLANPSDETRINSAYYIKLRV